MRKRTDELWQGAIVKTRKTFGDFVAPSAPGGSGTWRTIDDISHQPRDRKTEPDRLIIFTDGTRCHAKSTDWWELKEAPKVEEAPKKPVAAALRVARYLEGRRLHPGIDPELIHGVGVRREDETRDLTVSDLQALLDYVREA